MKLFVKVYNFRDEFSINAFFYNKEYNTFSFNSLVTP